MQLTILQVKPHRKLINIRTFIIILGLIALNWIVALILTQQRVQLEGLNSLNNVSRNISPFRWDFVDYERDLVESSKLMWQYNAINHSITAKAKTQAHLSLNFSSEVINSHIFNKLVIRFAQIPKSKLLIQFKTELEDEYFYYSPHINMTNQIMEIDLNTVQWKGVSDSSPTIKAIWGAQQHKISSLVLNFTQSEQPIIIDSIELPFNSDKPTLMEAQVDCHGNITSTTKLDLSTINHLSLSENCILPSTYMWLKREVHQQYPGSILTLADVESVQKPSVHRVNKYYIGLTYVNVVFYAWLVFILLVILLMMKYSAQLITKPTKINAQFNLKPSINAYGFILLPSLVIFLVLNYYKTASLSAFSFLLVYFIWALLQQFLLGYVLSEKVFYKNVKNKLFASLLAALVFSSLHLPSVSLFVLTFLAATFWSYAWLKYKKIIPLALSHSILALMLYHAVPESFLYSAKVFQWFWE